jgi:nuclear transport factor 2 (NTF2) superfamily protein
MAKEFNKKFMHPTRRKLVDMVLTGGEYQKETQISFSGADKEIIKHKVGERWTDDNGKSYEQYEAGKIEVSELGDIMAETRAYLDKLNSCKSENCKTIKIGRVDKKLISKTGYCLHCLALREAEIKYDGLWKEYEDYKIYSNMIAHGNDIVAQFKQAYKDAKQTYEVVQEDGKIETWSMERDVEELKAEILLDIVNFEKEIEQATQLRNEAYEKLKDKNYDLVRPLKD